MPSKSVDPGSGEFRDDTTCWCWFEFGSRLSVTVEPRSFPCRLGLLDVRTSTSSNARGAVGVIGLGDAGRGSGGSPREYAALYLHGSDSRVHLVHGKVPVHLVFFILHESQALVIFWRCATPFFNMADAFLLLDGGNSVEIVSFSLIAGRGDPMVTLAVIISRSATQAEPGN